MNWDQVAGNWKQMKGSLKQRWGKFTDDDLTMLHGKRDELVGKIQERYGITKEQAQKEADEWATAAEIKAKGFSANV
ncbi:MAG: CsbD family protein [Bryobacteraceae bacterium]